MLIFFSGFKHSPPNVSRRFFFSNFDPFSPSILPTYFMGGPKYAVTKQVREMRRSMLPEAFRRKIFFSPQNLIYRHLVNSLVTNSIKLSQSHFLWFIRMTFCLFLKNIGISFPKKKAKFGSTNCPKELQFIQKLLKKDVVLENVCLRFWCSLLIYNILLPFDKIFLMVWSILR